MNELDSFCKSLLEAEKNILDDIERHLDNGYIVFYDELFLLSLKCLHNFLKDKIGGDFDEKN